MLRGAKSPGDSAAEKQGLKCKKLTRSNLKGLSKRDFEETHLAIFEATFSLKSHMLERRHAVLKHFARFLNWTGSVSPLLKKRVFGNGSPRFICIPCFFHTAAPKLGQEKKET